MAKKKTQSVATTPNATTPEWGGLPVNVVEPEETVAEVEIPDAEGEQKAVAVKPKEEPKGKRRGSTRSLPVGATEAAPDASSSRSTRKPKKKGTTNTARDKADTGPTARAAKGKAAPKPDSTITLGELSESFLRHLELIGKSRGTVFSYGIELKAPAKHFGEDTKVTSLTVKKVADYFESDAVTKNRKGKAKDEKTVAKTRRVFRQALLWLAEVGVLEVAPLPETKKRDKSRN